MMLAPRETTARARPRVPACLLTFALCGIAPALAGETGPGEAAAARWGMTVDELLELHHEETARVRMVILEASVTDRKGRVVRGLGEDDFRLFEDQVPQEIAFFSAAAAEPLAAAFLLDVSGSMKNLDKLDRAKAAMQTLAGRFRPEDQLALIRFADEGVFWATDFTTDRRTLLDRLRDQRAHGRTALVDALAAAPGLVQERIRNRKAIVLLTDAADNSSTTPVETAVALAKRVQVPLYTIAFLSVSGSWLPDDALEERLAAVQAVADVTGGRVFPVYDDEELREALQVLESELSSQYLIGYYPVDDPDGEFHEVRLEVGRPRLEARTRSGYYARP